MHSESLHNIDSYNNNINLGNKHLKSLKKREKSEMVHLAHNNKKKIQIENVLHLEDVVEKATRHQFALL